MEWFSLWWGDLGFLARIMAYAAIPATVVMFLQLILMLIGIGSMGTGDVDAESDAGTDSSFAEYSNGDYDGESSYVHGVHHGHQGMVKFFTIRGIVAFFALGGWAGLALLSLNVWAILTIPLALLIGVGAMILSHAVVKFALKMQSSGNLDYRNAIDNDADVYITIPPRQSGIGKVTMVFQERFVEVDAVTDNETELKVNTKVVVTALKGKDCVVVSPK